METGRDIEQKGTKLNKEFLGNQGNTRTKRLQLKLLQRNRAPLQIRLDFETFSDTSKIPNWWLDAEKNKIQSTLQKLTVAMQRF